jgi:IS30 family transposase
MSYQHFTPESRNQLSALLRARVRKKDIAKILNKDRTSVWRERKRNFNSVTIMNYNARVAKLLAHERRIEANARFRKIENNIGLEKEIIRGLKKYWSPEQIAGRLKKENCSLVVVGKDTIYKFIYEQRPSLVKYLRHQKCKYRRKRGTKIREKQREEAKKVRIDQRPKIVEQRERLDDWEGDTIVGGERTTAILTHVERKSGYLMADKLNEAKAKNVKEATVKKFNRLPQRKRQTITYDNGSEFAEYELTGRQTKTQIYFAYPYHSWERGTNENTNGLLRQFYPKKTPFRHIAQRQLDYIVSLINNRPRKRLNYFSPKEIFSERCTLN